MRTPRTLRLQIQENRQYVEEERSESRFALCDYARGKGSCSYWCREEPECFTSMPSEGWPKPWVIGHEKRRLIKKRRNYR